MGFQVWVIKNDATFVPFAVTPLHLIIAKTKQKIVEVKVLSQNCIIMYSFV